MIVFNKKLEWNRWMVLLTITTGLLLSLGSMYIACKMLIAYSKAGKVPSLIPDTYVMSWDGNKTWVCTLGFHGEFEACNEDTGEIWRGCWQEWNGILSVQEWSDEMWVYHEWHVKMSFIPERRLYRGWAVSSSKKAKVPFFLKSTNGVELWQLQPQT